MNEILTIDHFTQETTMLAGRDNTGHLKEYFKTSRQLPACIFLLCTQGSCKLTIHLNEYPLQANSIAVIFPDIFCKIAEASNDCQFMYVLFTRNLINHTDVFTHTIEYTPYIFEQPIIELQPEVSELFQDYFKLLIKTQELSRAGVDEIQASFSFTQIILGLRKTMIPQTEYRGGRYDRNHEIVKELLRMAIQHYKSERNVSFYADKLHLSPQHLSTTVKKVTGKTLTEIISTLVIYDAQAKLRSSELTIQEIAYSLNFTDISFFGKYFKRYTGMSPKQYRNSL